MSLAGFVPECHFEKTIDSILQWQVLLLIRWLSLGRNMLSWAA